MPIASGQNGCHIPEPASSHFLKRTLRVWNCFTLAFSVVSPVVGLYAIFGIQNLVTGGVWILALALCLVMQASAKHSLTHSRTPLMGAKLE
jgi:hypothetical protein